LLALDSFDYENLTKDQEKSKWIIQKVTQALRNVAPDLTDDQIRQLLAIADDLIRENL
jgi:hypothetical protein